jgi:glycogen debranching enzyme
MKYKTVTNRLCELEDPKEERGGYTLSRLQETLDRIFVFSDEDIRAFFTKVVWRNVLAKLRAPRGALRRTWMTPGGFYFGNQAYDKQYIWDTMFMLDILALLPDQKETIREVVGNFWDNQDYTTRLLPPSAEGMIGHGFGAAGDTYAGVPKKSNNPLLAWGIERIYLRNGDKDLVRESLPRLEAYHDWYWRERDLDGLGLIGVGAYENNTQTARDEVHDFLCDMDNLILSKHRDRPDEEAYYGNIHAVMATAYLIDAEKCLARLARLAGEVEMARRREERSERATAAMRDRMWSEEAGTFLSLMRDGRPIRTVAISSWIPLYAGVPDAFQTKRMIQELSKPEWMTPLPVPTVGRTDPLWEPGRFSFLPDPPKKLDHLGQACNSVRGDVWPPENYHIAVGLAQAGERKLAARITDATILIAMIHDDANERYDCDTGEPLGVPHLGMSACILSMLLDGLSERFNVSYRQA